MGNGDKDCPLCGAEVKTTFHIFKRCTWIRAITFGSKWGCCLDQWEVNNIQEMIHDSFNPTLIPCFKDMDPHFVTVFLSFLCYVVWKSRNHLIHQFGWTVEEAIKSFEWQVMDFIDACLDDVEEPIDSLMDYASVVIGEGWSPPFYGWIKINYDAAFSNGGSLLWPLF